MRRVSVLVLALVILFVYCGAPADEESAFREIGSFSEGLAAVQNEEGLWGYIDRTGELVIPCEWESVGAFSDGIASVRKGRKFGCVDRSGQLVIPCVWNGYSHIAFSEGLAPVQNEEKLWGFIDTTGTVVIPCEWEGVLAPRFSDGLAAVEKDGRMGYINRAGETVIPCVYKYAPAFSHGYAAVQDNEGLLFINTAGEVAFPEIPHATAMDSFREDGIAFLEFSDHTGLFIDTDGHTVCTLSAEYRYRSDFREGLAGIAGQNEQGEWNGCEGYIDRTGAVVIPLELYSSYNWFMNGRACIPEGPVSSKETRYGVIDHSGTLVYPYALDKAVEFRETVAAAVQDNRAGAIDTDGIIIVPFVYDDVTVGDGIVLCLLDGQISLFDYSGNVLR